MGSRIRRGNDFARNPESLYTHPETFVRRRSDDRCFTTYRRNPDVDSHGCCVRPRCDGRIFCQEAVLSGLLDFSAAPAHDASHPLSVWGRAQKQKLTSEN